MHRHPHLPSADLPLDNLTRRQAAVFEHMAGRALTGIRSEINMHEWAADKQEASSNVRDEHRREVRELKVEMDRVHNLVTRLRKLRTAPLTAEEEARLAAARAVREITSEEADAIIYGTLAAEEIEPDHSGILQEAAE